LLSLSADSVLLVYGQFGLFSTSVDARSSWLQFRSRFASFGRRLEFRTVDSYGLLGLCSLLFLSFFAEVLARLARPDALEDAKIDKRGTQSWRHGFLISCNILILVS